MRWDSVQFRSYQVDDGTLELYAEGEADPYKIAFFQDYGDVLPSPEVLCGGGRYSVGVEGESHYVKSLTGQGGSRYITLETERKIYRESQRGAVRILSILSPLGAVFCYFGIAVARHPDRFRKKFRQLFYKKGFLH